MRRFLKWRGSDRREGASEREWGVCQHEREGPHKVGKKEQWHEEIDSRAVAWQVSHPECVKPAAQLHGVIDGLKFMS